MLLALDVAVTASQYPTVLLIIRCSYMPVQQNPQKRRLSPQSTPEAVFELSVLIPVYNEESTVIELLRRVASAPYRKQIIVVDDGSSDGTRELLDNLDRSGLVLHAPKGSSIEIHYHPENRGKGAALRTALQYASAPFTIVQDADLEYDPQDYPLLVNVLERGYAETVYGSRYMAGNNYLPNTRFKICVKLLNWMVGILYGQTLTDEATCYKAFPTELLKSLKLESDDFRFCPEVTAKVRKRGIRIIEIPISYDLRTSDEGKKIGWKDGVLAIWALIRYRFLP